MRVWWLEKLPARRASFVWEFIPRQTKTVSSILLETVMFHYRGATQIDCFSPLCSHTIICAGRITGPDPAGTYLRIHCSGRPQKSIQQIPPYCNPTACSSL